MTDRRTDGQNTKLIGSFFQNKLPKKEGPDLGRFTVLLRKIRKN